MPRAVSQTGSGQWSDTPLSERPFWVLQSTPTWCRILLVHSFHRNIAWLMIHFLVEHYLTVTGIWADWSPRSEGFWLPNPCLSQLNYMATSTLELMRLGGYPQQPQKQNFFLQRARMEDDGFNGRRDHVLSFLFTHSCLYAQQICVWGHMSNSVHTQTIDQEVTVLTFSSLTCISGPKITVDIYRSYCYLFLLTLYSLYSYPVLVGNFISWDDINPHS